MNQEKERIFLELQAEIKANLEAYERGEYITLEKMRGNNNDNMVRLHGES